MNAPLDTDVAIETPEHIVFHYRLAGPARRGLAYVIDLVLVYGIVLVLVILVVMAFFSGTTSGDLGSGAKAFSGLVLLALFAAQWVWFVVWEATRGQSPGKKWTGVRVLAENGRPIGWRAAALRNLLRAADALPTGYLVGLASMSMSSRFQRLGDLAAGTIVVVPERVSAATPIELSPPAKPKELATLPDDVSLDADEREAIELFLRRRHTLGHARELELARMIAQPIAARFGFRHDDPSRLLAILYDRAVNAGRTEAPPSSWRPRARERDRNGPRKEGAPPRWP
ncbi:MAG: hypothetical protein JWP87_1083 [Labilithrix sp.]|nr:hypothetical protein [Labilithrix sp.]